MVSPEEKKSPMDQEVKKESIESKQKHASERFLSLMKKNREDEQLKKEADKKKREENAKNENSKAVSTFVSDLSVLLSKILNKVNMWIDTMLASSKRIRVLSLFIAIILCYFVNGGTGITTTKSIDYIDNVPVTVIASDDYEIAGVDDTVTVQLIGDYASIQWAKVMKNFSVVLDAQNRAPGSYELNYRAEGFSSALDVKIIPDKVSITVSEKETRSFALGYQFINEEKMDVAYTLKAPQLAFLQVDVTAGESTLAKIDRVVAKIDVGNLTQSVVDGEASIVALDANGNELDVEIDQSTVRYDLDVISYSKVVPITLETNGDVDSQYVLTEITPSIDQVTVYGLEEELKNITEVVAVVDITDISTNSEISGVALRLPENASKLSTKVISVDIRVEKKVTVQINDIPIALESCPSGLQAKLLDDVKASLKVTGAKSKVEALNKDNVKVYIDLSDASVGTSTYSLKIANADSALTYEWVGSSNLDVVIQESS